MLININVFTKNNHIFQNFKNIMNRVVLFYMTAKLFDVSCWISSWHIYSTCCPVILVKVCKENLSSHSWKWEEYLNSLFQIVMNILP